MHRARPLLLLAMLALLPRWAAAGTPPDTATRGIRATFYGDMAQIASMRTLAILASGGALAGVCAVLETSSQGTDASEGNWWDESSDVGNAAGNAAIIGAVAGAALLVGHYSKSQSLYMAGSEMARSVLYSGVVTIALKAAVQRTRPDGAPYSFPSGHAAAAFSIAPVLAARFGIYAAVPAYLLAGVTAFGRVEERKHYPSEVVFGATLGLASGIAVTESDATFHGLAIVVEPEGVGLAKRF